MSDQEDVYPETREYASPPCFMHQLVPGYGTEPAVQDAWPEVCRWRKAERKRLIDERLAIDAEERNARSLRIASVLDLAVGRVSGRIVSGYWPFRGEPDLRNWAIKVIERGGRIALPVVIKKGWPLEFRVWRPGDPLERGIWNILVPPHGPSVQPDVVIAPVVGFDEANYRLGYGGGFFDRTLAAAPRRPLVVGVGYARSRIRTIYPQPQDIPMDVVVTDE
ncbi:MULTISPECIES: 5-formyltetrahydrofolate cyclo-ligase [unclassified Mesorhizobium]|uniref:5-formyltetrahydrofolate cyclo-ligase n=1 Tax=unclassified Mesorhizobium TaxID=325217 RepID=UPI00112D18E5|nr:MULTISPECIES: 5-formyltetrahydrofolate cyclo-ligase [unclassified Mesorhizobium]TPI45535.1 5-formyltetrahydrofolate cyclo-ligase [Mesorhizobium sp. B3-1-1]TPJ68329.1 5-formyltetrahydrofolate cyclo-ligase [Mesorhizobium sp. B2-6-7]TPJ76999.1 5-formyltetrahydrofolate cyclo-ligase [Mesorhizobium sp. B2-6-3]TPJ91408.1 5-formyltetrahydrofolate cyclo-ligase [Mesorhizobium sp. B2-5-10]TPK09929.1 5-formyltetrahydrofolate cyclo-ligase [Mesorhizobium sp. B2-5-11]